MYLNMI